LLFIDVNGDSIDVSHMSNAEFRAYNDFVDAERSRSRLFNAMYTSLESSGKMYTVEYGETVTRSDGSQVDGQFVPNDKGGIITLLRTDIVAQSFNEEFFHAYQNDHKNQYENGDFNFEFEAKLAVTAMGEETEYGTFDIPGMWNFQNRVRYGEFGTWSPENGTIPITPEKVSSESFLNGYASAANIYAEFNRTNNIGNDHYKVSTTVSPFSLIELVSRAYGR
jgi:hypothetical protein